jgi:RNA polymerase sigma-70 factor (sigma-E family)
MPDLVPDLDAFVAANIDGLLRTAFLVTMDEGEAEDLVQECLLKVAQRWRRIRVMDHPLAYARRILVNLAISDSTARSRRRAELIPEVAEAVAQSVEIELAATRDEVWLALRKLPPRQRAVLVLRYFHDLSETQVGEILQCAPSTVSSTVARSLSRLRGLLEPTPAEERSDQR